MSECVCVVTAGCAMGKKRSKTYLKWGLNDKSVWVKLIKIARTDEIQFVLSLLSECTEDSSSERLHKPQI